MADLVYPTVEDVFAIHEAVVASDHETEAGVRSPEITYCRTNTVPTGGEA